MVSIPYLNQGIGRNPENPKASLTTDPTFAVYCFLARGNQHLFIMLSYRLQVAFLFKYKCCYQETESRSNPKQAESKASLGPNGKTIRIHGRHAKLSRDLGITICEGQFWPLNKFQTCFPASL